MGAVNWRTVPSVLIAVTIVGGIAPRAAVAQEGASACDRLLTGAEQQATEEGITFLWRNFRAGCGDARMNADSAVVRERSGVLLLGRLIRNVRYQDSTRSLTSDSLTYSGVDDRVVAMGNVILTMRKSGARLSGPRVEFYRLTRSGAEQTIATGRPRLILEGDPADAKPPTTIDADRMEIFREDDAWYWGEVVIRRPDAVSYADSAFFDMVNESGVLHGGARMDGEDFELSGDSIRIEFADDELQAVHAFQNAAATGDGFDVASAEIEVRFTNGEVGEVVAFGSRSAALSEGYHLLGDSLRFRLHEGAMDSTFAIGSAVALEDTTAGLAVEPSLTVVGDAGWLAGDTIIASFRRLAPAAEAAVDSVAEPEPIVAEDSVAGDSVAVGEDVGGEAAEESGEAAPRSELEQLRTLGNARAFYVAADTTDEGPPARNYMIGDEIAIYFEDGKAVRVAANRAIGVYLDPDPDAVAVPPDEVRVPPAEGAPASRTDSLGAEFQPAPDEADPTDADAIDAEPTNADPADADPADAEPTDADSAATGDSR